MYCSTDSESLEYLCCLLQDLHQLINPRGGDKFKYFLEFSPRKLVKMNPFWRACFSDGLVQPPTSWCWCCFFYNLDAPWDWNNLLRCCFKLMFNVGNPRFFVVVKRCNDFCDPGRWTTLGEDRSSSSSLWEVVWKVFFVGWISESYSSPIQLLAMEQMESNHLKLYWGWSPKDLKSQVVEPRYTVVCCWFRFLLNPF